MLYKSVRRCEIWSKGNIKPSLEDGKVCGIITQINARAVLSNPAGKTNLRKNFQAYCSIDVDEKKEGSAYIVAEIANWNSKQ